ncbi:MAG: [FeFe] hydrogenase H-cluster radical SAM maturase HydE [Lentisphaeria bacterium]|nr:[FeFe] hydrogenase H-cluster radical SAM maturase HydE [Lentisphaeria bacterium]
MNTNTRSTSSGELENLLNRLETEHSLPREAWLELLRGHSPELQAEAAHRAFALRTRHFGNKVYLRGLIEFTNYCRNNCYYCGIRAGNPKAQRYRLTESEILAAGHHGYELGFRTVVLQGGEDPGFGDDAMARVVEKLKAAHRDCAVTLSCGERPFEVYRRWKEAGADRYLLRHESANADHYAKLHPAGQILQTRLECLQSLRELNFQVGAGFMVGSPYQTAETLADDLIFLGRFRPEMVGIGPFIPHCDTPFGQKKAGSVELTLYLLSLIRLMLPKVLLPATTALATLDPDGRRKGFAAGANVIMPNLSPPDVREKYLLYDHKAYTGLESADSFAKLIQSLAGLGFTAGPDRGDHPKE